MCALQTAGEGHLSKLWVHDHTSTPCTALPALPCLRSSKLGGCISPLLLLPSQLWQDSLSSRQGVGRHRRTLNM